MTRRRREREHDHRVATLVRISDDWSDAAIGAAGTSLLSGVLVAVALQMIHNVVPRTWPISIDTWSEWDIAVGIDDPGDGLVVATTCTVFIAAVVIAIVTARPSPGSGLAENLLYVRWKGLAHGATLLASAVPYALIIPIGASSLGLGFSVWILAILGTVLVAATRQLPDADSALVWIFRASDLAESSRTRLERWRLAVDTKRGWPRVLLWLACALVLQVALFTACLFNLKGAPFTVWVKAIVLSASLCSGALTLIVASWPLTWLRLWANDTHRKALAHLVLAVIWAVLLFPPVLGLIGAISVRLPAEGWPVIAVWLAWWSVAAVVFWCMLKCGRGPLVPLVLREARRRERDLARARDQHARARQGDSFSNHEY